jgi:hypothetical protein
VDIRPPLAGDLLAMAEFRRRQTPFLARMMLSIFGYSRIAPKDDYSQAVATMAMIQLLCTIDGKTPTMDEIKRLQATEFNLICKTISHYL